MTIGRGAGPDGLNLQVIPFRERTDFDADKMSAGSLVWLVKDIFTTHNGNWDVEAKAAIKAAQVSEAERREENEAVLAGPLFGIDQWARDAYLFPPNDPRYCTEGGADHDILVCVQGTDGARIPGAGVAFASDGPAWLQPPTDPERVVTQNTKAHGWCNVSMYASSLSYPPALGPWTVAKLSDLGASDLVTGMGLPWKWHVSTFIVYQAVRWGDLQPAYATLEEALHGEAQRNQLVRFNPSAALQARIFADGFTPNSNEFPLSFGGVAYVAQRAEHLGTGVCRAYFCEVGHYDVVQFTAWMP